MPFAGHAAVGAAWLIARITGSTPPMLRTAAGDAETWEKDSATWVRSTLGTTPAWWHEKLGTAADVEALTGPLDQSQDMTQLWAWQDVIFAHPGPPGYADIGGLVVEDPTLEVNF